MFTFLSLSKKHLEILFRSFSTRQIDSNLSVHWPYNFHMINKVCHTVMKEHFSVNLTKQNAARAISKRLVMRNTVFVILLITVLTNRL